MDETINPLENTTELSAEQAKIPSAKEIQDYQRMRKEQRLANKQNLDDFEIEVAHARASSDLIFERFRAMDNFIKSENLVEPYLAAVEKKKLRDDALQAKKTQEQSRIITPTNGTMFAV